ncbi:unnamed protein product [Rotaria socialis]|uniref:Uncharacterized protein n=1 Tax=Rotaria socialis TaxID=392032 RepID=A0A818F267_9BILA|nr:unnamed protein product [Rotaria socialis]CAF4566131.1 unnamed protein product [Rotaria socialis]
MIRQTYIVLTVILILFSLTTANRCPCELVVNENPTIPNTDLSPISSFMNDNSTEDYIVQIADSIPSTNKYQKMANLYPLIRQRKSLSTTRRRFKRPSWATIGKRSFMLIRKRPSWAQIG